VRGAASVADRQRDALAGLGVQDRAVEHTNPAERRMANGDQPVTGLEVCRLRFRRHTANDAVGRVDPQRGAYAPDVVLEDVPNVIEIGGQREKKPSWRGPPAAACFYCAATKNRPLTGPINEMRADYTVLCALVGARLGRRRAQRHGHRLEVDRHGIRASKQVEAEIPVQRVVTDR